MIIRFLTDRIRRYRRLAALAWAAMSVCVPQPAAAGNSDLASDTIALPKGTVEGVLPNGLRYLILPNGFPAGRTEFRLVWKVGSVQQDDSQGGCAHFLEHMAFGGSENFPDRGAVAYLESLGMKYGIDINAFTGHDRTIYMFATPADTLRASGFAKPLSIIRDWTDRLTINPDRVETEKGIILEELRSTFQEDPFYDLKIGQNRFSSRMPLGTPEEVGRMTAEVLNDYYRKWYVPRLGAVIVAGDLDAASVEKEIRRQFSSLKPAADPGYRTYPLDYTPRRQIMVEADLSLVHISERRGV
ncbi:MAG: insulinase family protein, partial [Muribaculaceae bacterium]|nr:insulinase family protein [Muribaculaceae bacterium]